MKKLLLSLSAATLLTLGVGCAGISQVETSAAKAPAQTAPKTVIHVVSVKWKADATPEQINAAIAGVQALPASFKGITRVWTKAFKVQGEWSHILVMEFADEAALKNYSGSDAQKEWYKVYLPIREKSNTHDITN